MPKTYRNLYPRIYDFENLFKAYLKARKNKRYTEEALEFSANLEENLIGLQNDLIYRTYRPGRYREFYIYEPKKRLVAAPPFRDRVLHHAICNVIEPIFEARFIYDTYACRPGKGAHKGADRVTYFLRVTKRKWSRVYCLKCDIKQYFPSINHRILKDILRKHIGCRDTLALLDCIIDSVADKDDPNPTGLPIGNLTSQLFANIYLSELDYFIKHDLRVRYYVRYMDDFVILHNDKRFLRRLKGEIESFLDRNLALELNGKTSIFPVSQGIDFLGYRIWSTHRLLRKSSIKRMRRRLKRFKKQWKEGKLDPARVRASIASWLGHCRHANTHRITQKILSEFRFGPGEKEQ